MKLYEHIKRRLNDFIVEEKITFNEGGDYPLYRLKKSNISTIEAIRLLAKIFKIHPADIGFAGLKDKFGITSQYITLIKKDIPEKLCLKRINGKWVKVKNVDFSSETGLCIKFIGNVEKKLSIGEIDGNYFRIKIRNLSKEKIKKIHRNIEIVRQFGFPNYFGEQRFGNLKGQKDFILLYLLKGDYKKVIEIYLKNKGYRGPLGNWEEIYGKLKDFLEVYEKDFILGLKRGLKPEKALRILPKNVRLMFNFAFQSFLWNRYLHIYIREKYPYKTVDFINNWKLNFYTYVGDLEHLKNLEIPYTGKDFKIKDCYLETIIPEVLKEFKIKESDFGKEVIGIKILTDGKRKAIIFPKNIEIYQNSGNSLTISFFLPTGSYATVLLRNLLS